MRRTYKTSNNAYIPTYPAAIGYDFATGIGTINCREPGEKLGDPAVNAMKRRQPISC
jgi:hypothetical protein